jgi:predicted Fe-Mo cluster-binding NifX family protein
LKIAITAKDNILESEIDPRFGRCNYFLIINSETMDFKPLSNVSSIESGGAGIQAAQTLAKHGVKIVLTGNMGPNAFQTLSAAGIKVYTGASGTVREAIEKYKNGEFLKAESPNVSSHSGIRG